MSEILEHTNQTRLVHRAAERGFALLGAIVAIFLVLLALSVAAPTVARALRREREVEAVHRGDQYVRAIQLYYRKFGHYPASIEQLEKSNNVRFLRQKYPDPMTGKPDWRLIHVGEQKTTVKGFFGQPLAGLPTAGVGGAGIGGGGTSTVGGSSMGAGGLGSAGGLGAGGGVGSGSTGPGGLGSGSAGGSAVGSPLGSSTVSSSTGSSTSGTSGISSQSATSFQGGGAPFLGIGSSAPGDSIVVLNEQTSYPTWEFIYDPRIEQMKQKVNIFGGGMTNTNATTFGSSNGLNSPGSTTSPTTGPGPTALPTNPSPTGPSTPTTPTTPTTPQ